MKRIFTKLKTLSRLFSDLRESIEPTVSRHGFEALYEAFDALRNSDLSVTDLLKEQSARASLGIGSDWEENKEGGFWQMSFTNSLFADGEIKFYKPKKMRRVLVFFPGTLSTADDIVHVDKDTFGLRKYCAERNIGLYVWDWPLQGQRKNWLYKKFHSYASVEKEYSRTLGLLGTCLWREYIEEATFCLKQMAKIAPDQYEIEVCGWSQGGLFAWFSPYLSIPIKRVTVAGSCALYRDLLKSGRPHIHGYFYYPTFNNQAFDLDDVLVHTLQKGINVSIIHGTDDRGCLAESVEGLQLAAKQVPGSAAQLIVNRLPNVGHSFPGAIQNSFFKQLDMDTDVRI